MLALHGKEQYQHDGLNLPADLQAVVHVGRFLEAPCAQKPCLPVWRPRHKPYVMLPVEL